MPLNSIALHFLPVCLKLDLLN